MRYDDSKERSAEYLRLALPYMSQQTAALHPVSYAVWYEYVSGRNASLRTEIDSLTKAGGKLDEAKTTELFRKHVSEVNETLATMVGQGLQKVMTDMSRSASEAGVEANRFGDVLEKMTTRADTFNPTDLLKHTLQMKGAVNALSKQLDESHKEIDHLREEVRRAREDASLDGLTGLTNRKAFDMALANCLQDLGKTDEVSLLIADIDFFKRVNDSYGHLFGDKVIRSVAEILKQNTKGKDTAARYGGEEFVVLLPNTSLNGARAVAEQIRVMVQKIRIRRSDTNELIDNISVSLGVASYSAGESSSDFLARADKALYASKENGRNRVTLATA